MKPGDRLFCLFVTNLPEGETFIQWPLHVTLIPWFRLDADTSTMSHELQTLLKAYSPLHLEAAAQAQPFGHQPTKLATLITPTSSLRGLEQDLRRYLTTHQAWLVDESVRVKRGFTPHVTEQGPLKVIEGQHFVCDAVYVIEQLGSKKCVVAKLSL